MLGMYVCLETSQPLGCYPLTLMGVITQTPRRVDEKKGNSGYLDIFRHIESRCDC